jgi:hypothetical protein
MLCAECQNLLSDFIDGDLAERQRRAVEEHVVACLPCDSLRVDLARIVEASRNLPLHTPSPRVWERIEREIAGPQVVAGPRSWWDRLDARRVDFSVSGKHIAAAAALVLVAVGTLWTINLTRPDALPEVQVSWSKFAAGNQDAVAVPLAAVTTEVDTFRKTVGDMAQSVEAKRSTWSPELQEAFTKSVAAIDAKIAEAERAHEAAQSAETRATLMAALTAKLELLEKFATAGQ